MDHVSYIKDSAQQVRNTSEAQSALLFCIWRLQIRLLCIGPNHTRGLFLAGSDTVRIRHWWRFSLSQALLETDPSERQPADLYLSRYQSFARADLDRALDSFRSFSESLGENMHQVYIQMHRIPIAISSRIRFYCPADSGTSAVKALPAYRLQTIW